MTDIDLLWVQAVADAVFVPLPGREPMVLYDRAKDLVGRIPALLAEVGRLRALESRVRAVLGSDLPPPHAIDWTTFEAGVAKNAQLKALAEREACHQFFLMEIALHKMITLGTDETPEGEAIRDRMDDHVNRPCHGAELYGLVEAAIRREGAALAAEREACARLADVECEDPGDDVDSVLTRLAAAIRARGEGTP